jgi:Glycosyl transferases group 1
MVWGVMSTFLGSAPALNEKLIVSMGPQIDLHVGIHDSLLQDAPETIRYEVQDATHVFLFPRSASVSEQCSPYKHIHWGEFVQLSGAGVVHTARWPALDTRAWLTDMDDFGYPVLAGRHALCADFRRQFRAPWSPSLKEHIDRRVTCMLTAYAHPSCKAILFRTRNALRIAADWLRELDTGALGAAFLSKSEVLYPAQKACPWPTVRAKWQPGVPLRVLFCGRDYAAKNGLCATRTMARLAQRHPSCQFTYIGEVPSEVLSQFASFPSNFEYLGRRSRVEVLKAMSQAHLLFHPAHVESLGMVLVEAAAAGLAIICSAGRGMQHLAELLGTEGAATVDVDTMMPHEDEAYFEAALESLLRDPCRAKAMAMSNYERTTRGVISLETRNERLAELYRVAAHERADEPLRLDELPYVHDAQTVKMPDATLMEYEQDFRDETGFTALNVYV